MRIVHYSLFIIPDLVDDYTYLWSNGSVDKNLLVNIPGTYSLEISKHGLCSKVDTIRIDQISAPTLDYYEDILLCEDESVVVRANDEQGSVIWNNTTEADSFIIRNYKGEVNVKYYNVCGVDSTSFNVELIPCNCNIIFPDAFTPNNDKLNDEFQPYLDCPKLISFDQEIYNRWGEKIYSTQDLSNPWNGNVNQEVAQNGLYFHITIWVGIENGLRVRRISNGSVYLLR